MKSVLESAALILGLVNGVFLLRLYLRDRPKLKVSPIHPDVYQWWFRLPDATCADGPTRRFGFLVYLAMANAGLRPTTLDRWRLTVTAANGVKHELAAMSIREPTAKVADNLKVYPVLGAQGPSFDGSTRLEPGGSISGMAYYEYECYGNNEWDPERTDGEIAVLLTAREVFGRESTCRITCHERPLHEIEGLVPDIVSVGLVGRT